ncbi:hypothetical protein HELRODRAFT_170884 [Helobdella robusta]|uniref:Uncharacterized protein n=1 Tax=Helobdella robusta TaxID=6412 RepID=T1F3J7_HELRO|nr:hypothetical protein HELRODRAFT_170884 [Helobdella robusta]ESO06858.1 hypothetical protein HELRODRAFT_170884 [Helobdella robusta]
MSRRMCGCRKVYDYSGKTACRRRAGLVRGNNLLDKLKDLYDAAYSDESSEDGSDVSCASLLSLETKFDKTIMQILSSMHSCFHFHWKNGPKFHGYKPNLCCSVNYLTSRKTLAAKTDRDENQEENSFSFNDRFYPEFENNFENYKNFANHCHKITKRDQNFNVTQNNKFFIEDSKPYLDNHCSYYDIVKPNYSEKKKYFQKYGLKNPAQWMNTKQQGQKCLRFNQSSKQRHLGTQQSKPILKKQFPVHGRCQAELSGEECSGNGTSEYGNNLNNIKSHLKQLLLSEIYKMRRTDDNNDSNLEKLKKIVSNKSVQFDISQTNTDNLQSKMYGNVRMPADLKNDPSSNQPENRMCDVRMNKSLEPQFRNENMISRSNCSCSQSNASMPSTFNSDNEDTTQQKRELSKSSDIYKNSSNSQKDCEQKENLRSQGSTPRFVVKNQSYNKCKNYATDYPEACNEQQNPQNDQRFRYRDNPDFTESLKIRKLLPGLNDKSYIESLKACSIKFQKLNKNQVQKIPANNEANDYKPHETNLSSKNEKNYKNEYEKSFYQKTRIKKLNKCATKTIRKDCISRPDVIINEEQASPIASQPKSMFTKTKNDADCSNSLIEAEILSSSKIIDKKRNDTNEINLVRDCTQRHEGNEPIFKDTKKLRQSQNQKRHGIKQDQDGTKYLGCAFVKEHLEITDISVDYEEDSNGRNKKRDSCDKFSVRSKASSKKYKKDKVHEVNDPIQCPLSICQREHKAPDNSLIEKKNQFEKYDYSIRCTKINFPSSNRNDSDQTSLASFSESTNSKTCSYRSRKKLATEKAEKYKSRDRCEGTDGNSGAKRNNDDGICVIQLSRYDPPNCIKNSPAIGGNNGGCPCYCCTNKTLNDSHKNNKECSSGVKNDNLIRQFDKRSMPSCSNNLHGKNLVINEKKRENKAADSVARCDEAHSIDSCIGQCHIKSKRTCQSSNSKEYSHKNNLNQCQTVAVINEKRTQSDAKSNVKKCKFNDITIDGNTENPKNFRNSKKNNLHETKICKDEEDNDNDGECDAKKVKRSSNDVNKFKNYKDNKDCDDDDDDDTKDDNDDVREDKKPDDGCDDSDENDDDDSYRKNERDNDCEVCDKNVQKTSNERLKIDNICKNNEKSEKVKSEQLKDSGLKIRTDVKKRDDDQRNQKDEDNVNEASAKKMCCNKTKTKKYSAHASTTKTLNNICSEHEKICFQMTKSLNKERQRESNCQKQLEKTDSCQQHDRKKSCSSESDNESVSRNSKNTSKITRKLKLCKKCDCIICAIEKCLDEWHSKVKMIDNIIDSRVKSSCLISCENNDENSKEMRDETTRRDNEKMTLTDSHMEEWRNCKKIVSSRNSLLAKQSQSVCSDCFFRDTLCKKTSAEKSNFSCLNIEHLENLENSLKSLVCKQVLSTQCLSSCDIALIKSVAKKLHSSLFDHHKLRQKMPNKNCTSTLGKQRPDENVQKENSQLPQYCQENFKDLKEKNRDLINLTKSQRHCFKSLINSDDKKSQIRKRYFDRTSKKECKYSCRNKTFDTDCSIKDCCPKLSNSRQKSKNDRCSTSKSIFKAINVEDYSGHNLLPKFREKPFCLKKQYSHDQKSINNKNSFERCNNHSENKFHLLKNLEKITNSDSTISHDHENYSHSDSSCDMKKGFISRKRSSANSGVFMDNNEFTVFNFLKKFKNRKKLKCYINTSDFKLKETPVKPATSTFKCENYVSECNCPPYDAAPQTDQLTNSRCKSMVNCRSEQLKSLCQSPEEQNKFRLQCSKDVFVECPRLYTNNTDTCSFNNLSFNSMCPGCHNECCPFLSNMREFQPQIYFTPRIIYDNFCANNQNIQNKYWPNHLAEENVVGLDGGDENVQSTSHNEDSARSHPVVHGRNCECCICDDDKTMTVCPRATHQHTF